MDYDLEYKIEVRKEEKNKVLYEWYIAQIDDEGKEVGLVTKKCIPFQGLASVIFKNISYTSTIEINSTEIPKESFQRQIFENNKFEKSEYIGGDLVYDPDDSVTQFSMFGTDRVIENIYLNIYKSDHPSCFLTGSVSRTDEFEGFTSPDRISIKVGLVKKQFDEIVEKIQNKSISSIHLQLDNVDGFYANWNPVVSAHYIKVLTRSHEIEIPKKADTQFKHLGAIGELNLSITTTNEMVNSQLLSLDNIDDNNIFDDAQLSKSEFLLMQTKDEILKLGEIIKAQRKFMFGVIFLLLILVIIF